MASLRHLCRSLQRSAKMPKMCGFASRNGCKDGIVHTGGISTYKYYIPPVWTGPSLQHSWTFSIRSAIFVPSLRRLCCSLCRSLLQRPRRTPPKKFENTPHFFMISRHVFKTFFSSYVEKNVATLKIQWKHVGIPCFPSRKRGVACVVAIYGCTCSYVNIKSLKKCGVWIWPNFGF